MQMIRNKFIGIWQLISCTEVKNDGESSYPWGADAIGYIIYMPENIMAVQIMRQHREAFKSDNFMHSSADECHALPKDYNAYFGSYVIDEEKQTVVHHIEGHIFPNLVGQNNVRRYQFTDNRLSLTTMNGSPERKMLWKKIG